jgi:hypothetical protein
MPVLRRVSMRILSVLVFLPLLAGCSGGDWDYLFHFGNDTKEAGEPAPPPKVAAAAPPAGAQPAQAPAPDPFCLAVAKEDATESGFDTATENRVALRSYQQCVQIFGANAGK